MTEHQCRGLTDTGESLELLTVNCPLQSQAQDRFRDYAESLGFDFEIMQCVSFERVNVEES